MRKPWLALVLVAAASVVSAGPRGDEPGIPGLLGSDGRWFAWHEWLADNGPAAVLLWSTWAPESSAVLDRLEAIERACEQRELALVLVAVQEDFDAARAGLGERQVLWIHDRHGAVLKRLRAFRVPVMVVVEADGEVRQRLEPTAEALLEAEVSVR